MRDGETDRMRHRLRLRESTNEWETDSMRDGKTDRMSERERET